MEAETTSTPDKGQAYNWDDIPLWKVEGKRFELVADELNGRIPVTRLESWKEFAGLLNDPFFNRPGVELVFRGHRRYDWSLTPSLGRLTKTGIISKETAATQLERFRRAVRGRLDDHSLVEDDQKDELWSVGQHHGLMTPLLDWTYAPYVALFFAFGSDDPREEREKSPTPYRAVYVLNKSFVNNDAICPDIRVIEPRKDDHGRLVNQAGLFTYSPLDSTIEDTLANTLSADSFPDDALRNADEDEQAEVLARYICKIYIKNEDREGCLRHLWLMNVHHASLFPDLQGAALYCNGQIGFKRGFQAPPSPAAVEPRDDDSLDAPDDSEPPDTPDLPPVSNDPPVVVKTKPAAHSLALASASAVIDAKRLKAILAECMGSFKVAPKRLDTMAADLAKNLPSALVVDWDKRDSGIARVRLFIRQLLRTYQYPAPPTPIAVESIVSYLRAVSLPGITTGNATSDEVVKTPAEIKRERDVKLLQEVFRWISLGAVDRFLYNLGINGWLTNEGHFLWERLGWLIESSRFYLSDAELRARLITFMKAWGKCFTHFDSMEQHRNGQVFFFNVHDCDEGKYIREQNKRAKFNGEQAAPLKAAFDAFLNYVREHYSLEIDLETAGQEGLQKYQVEEAQTKEQIRLSQLADRMP